MSEAATPRGVGRTFPEIFVALVGHAYGWVRIKHSNHLHFLRGACSPEHRLLTQRLSTCTPDVLFSAESLAAATNYTIRHASCFLQDLERGGFVKRLADRIYGNVEIPTAVYESGRAHFRLPVVQPTNRAAVLLRPARRRRRP